MRRLCLLLWLTFIPLVPGPRPSAGRRDRADLEKRRVTAVRAKMRANLWNDLQVWWNMEAIADVAIEAMVMVAETVNVIVQRFPFLQSFMASWLGRGAC